MSFATDLSDDPNDPQNDPNAQGGTGSSSASSADSGVSLGGGGSGVASPTGGNTGGSAPQPKSDTPKPSSSGSWTNLQSYLDANSDQSTQMGGQIAGSVSGQAQSAKNDVDSAASDFTNNVAANTIQSDPSAVADATNLKAGGTLSSDEVSGFQKQANASYIGPTDFTKEAGYGDAQRAIDTAGTSLKQLGSESGRDVLLQNQYQNASANGYNQGEQNLDQMLLENNPNNQQTFAGLQNQWSGLGNLLTQAGATADSKVKNAIATDQATASAAQGALAKANTDFSGKLDSEVAQAKAGDDTAFQKLLSAIKSDQYTPDQLQSMGLNVGDHVYNADPTQFLTEATATRANSASLDDYAVSQALAQLAGAGSAPILSPADASQVGTAAKPYSFDNPGFQNAVANQASLAQTGYGQAWNQKQVIPSLGSPDPVSMADLQHIVDTVNTDPSPSASSLAFRTKAMEAINQWKQANPLFPGITLALASGSPAPTATAAPGILKGPIIQ